MEVAIAGEIEDLESWLRANGLRSADDAREQDATAGELEARADLEEQQKHVQSVYEKTFPLQQGIDEEAENRERMLEKLAGKDIDIATKDDKLSVPALKLARSCDTVLTMYHWETTVAQKENVSIDLSSFETISVQSFLSYALDSCYETIPDETLIDCCFIAHYLCARKVVDDIAEILVNSINTSNCYYFCQVANQLDLPKLFEHSLAHMMGSIGELESNPAWGDLTVELRERIKAMKSAIELSIHSGNRLYFGTMEEYIAIFAERVEYYRERLAEAKEQLELNRLTASAQARNDTEGKIQHQELRLRTLEIAFAEQKKLFISTPRQQESLSTSLR